MSLLGIALVGLPTCVRPDALRPVATVRLEKDVLPNTIETVAYMTYLGETPGGNGAVMAGGS